MPSTIQSGRSDDYATEIERHINEWPDEWLLNLYPTTSVAKAYLEACGDNDVSQRVRDHFAAIVLG